MSVADSCTVHTCSLDIAYIQYLPSIAGNSFYLAIFSAMLLAQVILLIHFRAWAFSATMICGLILEVLGYVGRIKLHYDPFGFTNFLLYLVCLTIAPAFFGAAVYLCLGRIIIIHQGENISRIKPRTYTVIFVTCDVISLVLQAAGGAITSSAEDSAFRNEGVNIMIVGLAFQVAALGIFMALGTDFTIRSNMRSVKLKANEAHKLPNPEFVAIRATRKWRLFLICKSSHDKIQQHKYSKKLLFAAIATATITIFIRSFFRVFELNGGFHSSLANNEPALMVLDGAMVSIACLWLAILHPGVAIGRRWNTV
ncbi:RTA1 like protein [Penicillium canescens]|nr:RTA1 like protein [Penicillium canescens]